MKSLRGKFVMAAIILSCGFVMQAEQASETKRFKAREAFQQAREAGYDQTARTTRLVALPGGRNSW